MQVVLIFLGVRGYLDRITYGARTSAGTLRDFATLEKSIINYFSLKESSILSEIKTKKTLEIKTKIAIGRAFNRFCRDYFIF